MRHIESVRVTGDHSTEWVALGPMEKGIRWTAEMVEDRQNERIAWHSLPGSDVENSGSVEFRSGTGGRGTLVSVNIDYVPGGCGPVAQFAIRSAFMLGAGRVIAIDRVPKRLEMAQRVGAETLNFDEVDDVVTALKDSTGNHGPDSCMDAVGMEASGHGPMYLLDRAKQAVRMATDRAVVLRQCIIACKKGGTVSVPGAYAGFDDKIPLGAFMNNG